jgi:F-type H+-transporting ATPase subunit gamma
MAQLIQIKQRISTVETIKKITHAMRLVSMSAHVHLTREQRTFQQYYTRIMTLFEKLRNAYSAWHNDIIQPTIPLYEKPLIILIGAQKGLCGTFNSSLFHTFSEHMIKTHYHNPYIIPIGKRAADFARTFHNAQISSEFVYLNTNTAAVIANAITARIFEATTPFSRVLVVSNTIKTFFMQQPQCTQIIPLSQEKNNALILSDEYIWDQDPHSLLTMIGRYFITSQIHNLLLQSLLAEHAARFISMDSSTRNAEKILETTRLQYNKLRQAKITKEIIELADAF